MVDTRNCEQCGTVFRASASIGARLAGRPVGEVIAWAAEFLGQVYTAAAARQARACRPLAGSDGRP